MLDGENEEIKPLTLDEALMIAEKHGIYIREKPLIFETGVIKITGVAQARIYLPHYIVVVSVDRKKKNRKKEDAERAWVEIAACTP